MAHAVPHGLTADLRGSEALCHPGRVPHGGRSGRSELSWWPAAGLRGSTYDAAGRIIERRNKRIPRKPDVWRTEWDTADRLTACTTSDGTRWTYRYDLLGRRTAKRPTPTMGPS